MKIIFNNDCRCFKKGETIELNFVEDKGTNKKNRFLFLIGDNGCGKSTILKALRKYKTTMTTSFCGGHPRKEKNVNLACEIKDIANDTTVEGLDGYECIDALDGELDNSSRTDCTSVGSHDFNAKVRSSIIINNDILVIYDFGIIPNSIHFKTDCFILKCNVTPGFAIFTD